MKRFFYFRSNEILEPSQLLEQVTIFPKMKGLDLIRSITIKNELVWSHKNIFKLFHYDNDQIIKNKLIKVVVIDFGYKANILNQLSQQGCSIVLLPANTSSLRILNLNPDGIMLTNGPGDPASIQYAISTIQMLLNSQKHIPIFGICMGHQILSLALGATTFKLKFGHRGLNHPAGLLQKVEITSQNHGFAVNLHDLSKEQIQISYLNLNDKTLAGISHRYQPIFSVQYHPEANPGPNDSKHLFHDFINLIKYYPR